MLTVDLVVLSTSVDDLRVLLIQRKHDPFRDKWALPGGFVDEEEPLDAAAHRELQEETALEGLEINQIGAFGEPARDPRGWTVSIAYMAEIHDDDAAPYAGDDAANVAWWALSDLPPLAFDHAKIIAQAQQRLSQAHSSEEQ